MGVKLSPKQAMHLAIQEARKGLADVAPNPPVGCVILDCYHQYLSSGYHIKYGADHAEVAALKKINNKNKLNGAHIFVTLEPCHHQGKTPSCSSYIAQFKFKSLTYGSLDPFTKGVGLDFLAKQGIKIIRSKWFQTELLNLIAPFSFTYKHKKSFVSLKIASSLDGVIAPPSVLQKTKYWITGTNARRTVHFLRAIHSGVLVGGTTIIKDNPKLNIRLVKYKHKKNKVIILDPTGQTLSFLPNSNLVKYHLRDDILVFCASNIKVPKKVSNYVKVKKINAFFNRKNNFFCLSTLSEKLYQDENVSSIMVEGGAICFAQFLKQKACQKAYIYFAPNILGKGLYWSKYFTQSISKVPVLDLVKWHRIDPDFMLEGYLHFK